MTDRRCIAMVDCNSFYASCERLIDPALRDRPVAVLSSNDGCIIARTDEVKALGIGMGVPLFKVRDLVERHGVVIRSANFDFYVDVSARIMRLLIELAPQTEVYSIDEAFLDLSGMGRFFDVLALGRQIRERVWAEVGIPVSVGLAPTKVLAKVANQLAKKRKTYVEALLAPGAAATALASYPIENVWGIGPRTARKFHLRGVRFAAELAQQPDALVFKLCSVTEVRVVRELRGITALALTPVHKPKAHIATSRSFGHDIARYADLREAVSYFTTYAAIKLRKQHSAAGAVYVYARTNPFRKGATQAVVGRLVRLPVPTDHTPTLIKAALAGLEAVYRPDLAYKKAGVVLYEIVPADALQASLFAELPNGRRSRISRVADGLNQRFGKFTLNWAVYHGEQKQWMPLSEYRAKPIDLEVTEADRDRVRPWW